MQSRGGKPSLWGAVRELEAKRSARKTEGAQITDRRVGPPLKAWVFCREKWGVTDVL